MQFMVSVNLNPAKGNAPLLKELAEAEFEAVRGLYMSGLLRQIWVREDKSGALILVEAEAVEPVTQAFASFPLVQEGIMRAPEIIALAPYFGFAPRG